MFPWWRKWRKRRRLERIQDQDAELSERVERLEELWGTLPYGLRKRAIHQFSDAYAPPQEPMTQEELWRAAREKGMVGR